MEKLIKEIFERRALEDQGKEPPKKAEEEQEQVSPAVAQALAYGKREHERRENEINKNGYCKNI
jgi:hypothetical protein